MNFFIKQFIGIIILFFTVNMIIIYRYPNLIFQEYSKVTVQENHSLIPCEITNCKYIKCVNTDTIWNFDCTIQVNYTLFHEMIDPKTININNDQLHFTVTKTMNFYAKTMHVQDFNYCKTRAIPKSKAMCYFVNNQINHITEQSLKSSPEIIHELNIKSICGINLLILLVIIIYIYKRYQNKFLFMFNDISSKYSKEQLTKLLLRSNIDLRITHEGLSGFEYICNNANKETIKYCFNNHKYYDDIILLKCIKITKHKKILIDLLKDFYYEKVKYFNNY